MTIKGIISGIDIVQLIGPEEQDIEAIVFDSRKARASTLFFAIKGTVSDGHNYIQQVIDAGCTAIVCEDLPTNQIQHVTYIVVPDSARARAA
ncbi:MAG: UDP-N-acetylmuramoyl-L-alanyl-D-glutamate--2,6-diaminopimelate ligase, partial [Chitinophagaceae bacterium]